MGYYFEDLANHLLFKERTSDFWEMNLHHFLTITLFGGMIMQNFIRPGFLVSWLHCVSDISTAGSRVLSHTIYKKLATVQFLFCILFWFIFRNICIPVLAYKCSLYLHFVDEELLPYNHAPKILYSLLSVLCLMHFYWLTLFIQMLINAIKSGDYDDKQRANLKKVKVISSGSELKKENKSEWWNPSINGFDKDL